MTVLAVHPGAYYHIETLEGERYARFFDRLVRPEALGEVKLEEHAVLFIPCRTPADRIAPFKAQLAAFLDQGGTIVSTGETAQEVFLPAINFTPRPTNWWWWLEEGADLGVRIAAPDHALFRYLDQAALTWHLHGFYDPPQGAEVLVVDGGGKPILYIDTVSTRGRLVITSLDPVFHHGSHFMPATTRFLDGFLPWMRDELDGRPA